MTTNHLNVRAELTPLTSCVLSSDNGQPPTYYWFNESTTSKDLENYSKQFFLIGSSDVSY